MNRGLTINSADCKPSVPKKIPIIKTKNNKPPRRTAFIISPRKLSNKRLYFYYTNVCSICKGENKKTISKKIVFLGDVY